MLNFLRLAALILGCTLTVAPLYLSLQFAYGVGQPPSGYWDMLYYLSLLLLGLPFGLGPLLISLPNTVAGPRTPVARTFAGGFLLVTIATLVFIGFEGYVTRIASPAIMLMEGALFVLFVWPARPFPRIA
ncbi:hypothetical protein ABT364_26030 [Massilia sp. SR12]